MDDDQPIGRRRSQSFIVEDHDSEEEIPGSGSEEGSGPEDGGVGESKNKDVRRARA